MKEYNQSAQYHTEIPLRTEYKAYEARNQARADREKKTLRYGLGVAATGAALALATMGGGEGQPKTETPNPLAPQEDVVTLPNGNTVEIADDQYRQLQSNPAQEVITAQPSTGERE